VLGLGALGRPLAAEKENRATLVGVASGRRLAGDRHEGRPLAASTLQLHAFRCDAREQASAAATEVTRRVAFRDRWAAGGSAFDDHLDLSLRIIINNVGLCVRRAP